MGSYEEAKNLELLSSISIEEKLEILRVTHFHILGYPKFQTFLKKYLRKRNII